MVRPGLRAGTQGTCEQVLRRKERSDSCMFNNVFTTANIRQFGDENRSFSPWKLLKLLFFALSIVPGRWGNPGF